MHEYLAIVGRLPTISLSEIAALLPDLEVLPSPDPSWVHFRTHAELHQQWFDRLGGTILLARRITHDAVDATDIPALLATEARGIKGKVTFAVRCMGLHRRQAEGLGMACKKHLKSLGVVSRFVGHADAPAKAIQLHDEGLLDPRSGLELVVIQDGTNLWVGRTVAAQNVKAYTLRDMDKPVRDTRVGLLPPKLAQVLLNLSRALVHKPITRVLDPFCGTGVIPMEAMLQGLHVLASDVAAKAVTGTQTNIEWVRKTFHILKKDVETEIWKQDATKPFALSHAPDVIVTEGTLGPSLRDRPTIKDAMTYAKQAADLTRAFLRSVSLSLPGVPVVMTLPLWYAQKRPIEVPDLSMIASDTGFRLIPAPRSVPDRTDRPTLVYRRPDQFVGREIVLLSPLPRDVQQAGPVSTTAQKSGTGSKTKHPLRRSKR